MKPYYQRLYDAGGRIAGYGANIAGHPLAIIAIAMFCLAWYMGLGEKGENSLTLILSVLAITLTQMVLNQQRKSEIALHMKMDELVFAHDNARNEIAKIEELTEAEIEKKRRSNSDNELAS